MNRFHALWFCLTLMVVTVMPGRAAASDVEPLPIEDTHTKQVLFVLNPTQTPVTAFQLVSYDKDDPQVAEIRALLGDTQGIRKVLMEDVASSEQAKADLPVFTVESLLNNYLVATYRSVDEANSALERLGRSSLILSATRNLRLGTLHHRIWGECKSCFSFTTQRLTRSFSYRHPKLASHRASATRRIKLRSVGYFRTESNGREGQYRV
jgi:hypothetical protein